MPFALGTEKLVPTAALREISRGSFEHLTLELDNAIAENISLFVGDSDAEVARIATFNDRVIVGTSDGRVLSAPYKREEDVITFGIPENVDVPVVDSSNVKDYVNRFMFDAVDTLLSGDAESKKESIIALMNLSESIETPVGDDEGVDLYTLVSNILAADAPWKVAFRENIDVIKAQIEESAQLPVIEPKYKPLVDGTIPEERFPLYLEPARKDLAAVVDRLVAAKEKISASYSPFAENASLENLDDAVAEFVVFSESVAQEIHDLCEHARLAIENEQCAMCVGQIHDALAESLADYEMAAAFVEKMATRFAA